jgi:hypothetical protein
VLGELFSELVTDPDIVRRLSDLLSGTENRYTVVALDADVHPLVGRWVPDFAVAGASGTQRVAELARDARPVLVDRAAAVTDIGDQLSVAAGRLVGGCPPRLCWCVPMVMWPGRRRRAGQTRTNCANCVALSRIGWRST